MRTPLRIPRSVAVLAILSLAALGLLGATSASAAMKPLPSTVLVLPVEWFANGTVPASETALPSRPAEVVGRAGNWFRDASHWNFAGWKTTAPAPLRIATPRGSAPSEESSSFAAKRSGSSASLAAVQQPRIPCDAQFYRDVYAGADAAARAKGINPDAYELVVYAYDGDICQQMPEPRFGAGLFEGRRIVFQGALSLGAVVHEVGHYVGLGHAAAQRCTSSGPPERPETSCVDDPAGDPYDAMGAGRDLEGASGAFNAVEQAQIGMLGGPVGSGGSQFWNVRDVVPDDVYLLQLSTLTDTARPGIKMPAARIEEKGTVYWVEYRAKLGVDAGLQATAGLIVHQEVPNPSGGAPLSKLIDMTPATPLSDAGLPLGQTWFTPLKGEVKLLSADANGAEVFVRTPTPPLPPTVFKPRPTVANPDPNNSVLVLNVGWSGGAFRNWAPVDEALLDRAAAHVNGAQNEWFRQSAPLGLAPRLQAYAGGSFTIPQPRLASGKQLGDCLFEERGDLAAKIAADADRVARQAGHDPSRFRYVLYVFTGRFCEFAGLANGRQLYVAEGQVGIEESGVSEHEFGHALGLGHANFLDCTDDAELGAVTFNDDHCTTVEYLDPYDAMGSSMNRAAYDAPHAFRLGWLRNQFTDVAAGDFTNTYNLRPFAESPREGSFRALRLQDGPNKFWLEYRDAVGVDVRVVPGVVVHVERPTDTTGATHVLDMTPGQPGFFLPLGQTWANPLGTMAITYSKLTATGAQITLSTQLHSVPDLRGLTPAEAEARVRAAGLRYGGVSGFRQECDGIVGRVATQAPARSIRVMPGHTVSVTLWEKVRNPGNCQ